MDADRARLLPFCCPRQIPDSAVPRAEALAFSEFPDEGQLPLYGGSPAAAALTAAGGAHHTCPPARLSRLRRHSSPRQFPRMPGARALRTAPPQISIRVRSACCVMQGRLATLPRHLPPAGQSLPSYLPAHMLLHAASVSRHREGERRAAQQAWHCGRDGPAAAAEAGTAAGCLLWRRRRGGAARRGACSFYGSGCHEPIRGAWLLAPAPVSVSVEYTALRQTCFSKLLPDPVNASCSRAPVLPTKLMLPSSDIPLPRSAVSSCSAASSFIARVLPLE